MATEAARLENKEPACLEKSLHLRLARLRIRQFDPIVEAAELSDHFGLRLCFDCLVTAGPRSS
jgi:hypothetical protein